MKYALTITTTGIEASQAMLAKITAALGDGSIAAAIETAVVDKVRKRFDQLAKIQNKLGGTSTNYWTRAKDATTSQKTGAGVIVTVSHRGVALHLHGGTVRPSGRTSEVTGKPIKFLTIPKIAAAHGKTVAVLRGLGVDLYAAGGTLRRQSGAHRDPKNDEIWFILAKQATFKPNPFVLPSEEGLAEASAEAIEELLTKATLLPGP